MEKFIQRLESFMKAEGINDNQMTVKAGLSVGLIGKCRKNGSGMASDSIEKILLAYPSLSADWLLTGRGEMLISSEPKNTAVEISNPKGAVVISDVAFLKDLIREVVSQELKNH